MRNFLLLNFFVFCVLITYTLNAQCSFFLYDTYMHMSKSTADDFEEDARTFGFVRISDTAFADNYRMILMFDKNKFKWIKNASLYSVPYSCDLLKEFVVKDTFMNYKLLPIADKESYLITGIGFTINRNKDSISYDLDNGVKLYNYSLSTDTINIGFHTNEFNNIQWSYKSVYVGRGKEVYFGQLVDVLIFKKIYDNYVVTTWFNELNMVPMKMKTTYFGSGSYNETNLVGCYQF